MSDTEKSKPTREAHPLTGAQLATIRKWTVAADKRTMAILRKRTVPVMIVAAIILLACLIATPLLLDRPRASLFPRFVPWLVGALLGSATLTLSQATMLLKVSYDWIRWHTAILEQPMGTSGELQGFILSRPLGYLSSLLVAPTGSVTIYLAAKAIVPPRILDSLLGREMPASFGELRLLFLGLCLSVAIGIWAPVQTRIATVSL
jgi:hypothetical protein